MDSHERIEAALELREPDRVPVFPQVGDHAGIIAGLTYDIMYKDAKRAANAHLQALERYGYDVVAIQVEPSWPVAEACGAQINYPPDKYPWIIRNVINEKKDLERLEVPDFMTTQSSAVMIEGTRLLAEQADVPVAAFMTGPLTFSLQLMPYNDLMVAIMKDRPFVHKLVKKSVAIIKAYGQQLRAAGASLFVICEHDVQMMMPGDLGEFVVNYLPELLKIFPHNFLHICGKVTPHLETSASSLAALEGLNMISVDSSVDLARVKALFSGKIGVAGNIDHVQLLPHATPQEVEEACRVAIEAGKKDGGYMLAPGCEITSDTPPENVIAMVKAAAKYGKY